MSEKASVIISETDSVRLEIAQQPTGPDIRIHYHTLGGNSPNANGNYIGLWQSNNGVVPNRKAVWSYRMPNDRTESTLTLMDAPINEDSYILGYCQTGDPKQDLTAASNVSASAIILASDYTAGPPQSMTLDIIGNSSSSVLSYTILRGTDYANHWIGIWKGESSIDHDAPMCSMQVKNRDANKSGKINLDDVAFQRGVNYTLVYFANGYNGSTAKHSTRHMVSSIQFTF